MEKMMKVVRLKQEHISDLLFLTEQQVMETIPHVPYEHDVVLHNAEWIAEHPDGETQIYLAYKDDGTAVGYIVAYLQPYLFNRYKVVGQEVIYVLPEFRGSRAGLMLLKQLDVMAKKYKALEVFGGIANRFNMDRTLAWFEKQGYEKVGYYVRKIYKEHIREESPQD